MNAKIAKRVAEILLEIKAVTISLEQPYRFTSGMLSPIYTDNRLLLGFPDKRKEIISYMIDLIRNENLNPEVIAGTATAGIPPAAWIADHMELPMVYVRGSKKAHGKGKQIEGPSVSSKNILVIEDLISTGKSSLTAVEAIREDGGKADFCVAYFDYGFSETRKKFKNMDVKLLCLTTMDEIFSVAETVQLISKKEQEVIRMWNKDPLEWEKKITTKDEEPKQTEF